MIFQLHERIDLKSILAVLSPVKSYASAANDSDIALDLILIDGDEDGEDFIGPEKASIEVRSHRANNKTAFKERTQS